MSTSTSKIKTRRLLGYGAVAGLAAASVNAAIYLGGRAAGVSYVARQTASGAEHIKLEHVVSFCLEAFVLGLVAALVVNRLRAASLYSLLVLGALIAVGSTAMDVPIESALPAKFLLASMHIVTGIAYLTALRASGVRRHAHRPAAPVPAAELIAA
jgi:hypothetical protein